MVPVLGLVGGIGAGKTTVAAILQGQGALVLDADAIGHALLDQRPSREAVLERFGPGVLDPADPERVNRRALARIVFNDRESLRALEAILHPRIRVTVEKAIRRVQRRREAPLIVLDAALLHEAGWTDLCDFVAFVDAPAELRRERVTARGWSAFDLAARELVQWSPDRKRTLSTGVIRNGEDREELLADVQTLWNRLQTRPKSKPRFAPEASPDDPGPQAAP